MALTSIAQVRRISGVSISLVPDADVTDTITEAEDEVERMLNSVFTPRERIDVLDGDDTIRIIVDKNPLLSLREVTIKGTAITIDGNIFISKESGRLELNRDGSPEEARFSLKPKSNIIRYVYGWVEETTTLTDMTSASIVGKPIVLSVTSETNFTVDDWVEVYGIDGNREAAKVTATATGTITVDELNFVHNSGSTVVLLKPKEVILKLMRLVSGIALVARVVGESFDDITGYTMGEFQVQKGEPFTQWRETALQLQKEAREILARVRPRPAIF